MQVVTRKFGLLILVLVTAASLVSCATKKQALVDDPSEKKEGVVPWNKPEPWESGGNLAGMTDRR